MENNIYINIYMKLNHFAVCQKLTLLINHASVKKKKKKERKNTKNEPQNLDFMNQGRFFSKIVHRFR